MICLLNKYFFLVPKNFDKSNMDFSIFDELGAYIGSIEGGIKLSDISENEKDYIESNLEDISSKIEASLKFQRQFGIPVERARELNLDAEEIIDIMEENWRMSVAVMDEVLGDHVD